MANIYPKRNLGPAENWGRFMETSVDKTQGILSSVSEKSRITEQRLNRLAPVVGRVDARTPLRSAQRALHNGVGLPSQTWTTIASSVFPSEGPFIAVFSSVTDIVSPSSLFLRARAIRDDGGVEDSFPQVNSPTGQAFGFSGILSRDSPPPGREITVELQAWAGAAGSAIQDVILSVDFSAFPPGTPII